MSLMLSAPRSRPSGAPTRIPQPRRNRPRRHGRSYERMEAVAKFHHTVDGLKTASEEEVASMLTAARLRFRYEPDTFELGDTTAFKPDFHLVDEDVYIEVTEGNRLRQLAKRKKIERVRALHGVTVRLIGPDELTAIRDGDLTLWDVIHQEDETASSGREEYAMMTDGSIGKVGYR